MKSGPSCCIHSVVRLRIGNRVGGLLGYDRYKNELVRRRNCPG